MDTTSFLVVWGIAIVGLLVADVVLRRRYPNSRLRRGETATNDRIAAMVGLVLSISVLLLALPALLNANWPIAGIQLAGCGLLLALAAWRWRRASRRDG